MKLPAVLAAAATALLAQEPAGRSAWQHRFSGTYKSLFSASRTVVRQDGYGDVLNRLRLSYDVRYRQWLQAHIDYDNQAHFGNLIAQPEFALVRGRQSAAWLDLQHTFVDRRHSYWDTSLYRGYVTLRSSAASLTVGRQRIGWGVARFWSPADVFNPLNPLQLEVEERQGVDAALLEVNLPHAARCSAAFLPPAGGSGATVAGQLGSTVSGYDLAAFFGRFDRDWMGGAEFAGQWRGAGLRGEITYRARDRSRPEADALRLTLGADYAFPNTLYVVGEYFYNQGQPAPGASDLTALLLFTSEIFTLHRHFASAGIAYDLTPLFRLEGYTVADLEGRSLFLMPQLVYNLTPNTDLRLGGQFFPSAAGGEFAPLAHLLFAELSLHF